jgi:GH25 family lysozyme M1 (1,4-beta-N-acetylmuramidase)
VPANDWGGHGWTLWQYGKAPVPGIRGKVDVNRYNGTLLAPLRIKNN